MTADRYLFTLGVSLVIAPIIRVAADSDVGSGYFPHAQRENGGGNALGCKYARKAIHMRVRPVPV